MEKSQVNEKYVLTLVENSDATLSVRSFLEQSEKLLHDVKKLRKKVLNHLLL